MREVEGVLRCMCALTHYRGITAAHACVVHEFDRVRQGEQVVPDDFTPLERAAWGGFLRVQSHLMRMIEDDLEARVGISHPEFEVLLRLSWADGRRMRIQDLAAHSLLTRSGVSRLVERLGRVGLITREDAPEDGRGAYAFLTDDGFAALQVAKDGHTRLLRAEFLGRFTKAELAQLVEFWRRLDAMA